MKRRKAGRAASGAILSDFARGAIATALLSAVQKDDLGNPRSRQAVLRRALQGGVALAAGTAAIEAARRHAYASALLSSALGGVGVLAAEVLLTPSPPQDRIEA